MYTYMYNSTTGKQGRTSSCWPLFLKRELREATDQLFAATWSPQTHCNATQISFLKETVHRSLGFFLNKQHFISNCPNYANSPDLSQRALNTEAFVCGAQRDPISPSWDVLTVQEVSPRLSGGIKCEVGRSARVAKIVEWQLHPELRFSLEYH